MIGFKRYRALHILFGLILVAAWAFSNAAPAMATTTGLDNDASQWGIYIPPGKTAQYTVQNVSSPSLDGNALKVSLNGGDSYTNLRAYRNLPAVATATTFQLSLSFYYTPSSTPVQALEFLTEKWQGGQHWEWALQWENIGSNGNPTWRIATGSGWQDTGVHEQLSANAWHSLQLYGEIVNGQARYIGFTHDGTFSPLGQTFAPTATSSADRLSVAVQLDADSSADPYQLVVDKVTQVALTNHADNLDNTRSAWQMYIDAPPKTASWTMNNVSSPSEDGNALQVSLNSGSPYVGLHAYRTLASAPNANSFQMDLDFYFGPSTLGGQPVQALEFTFHKNLNGRRYEFALQWENINTGGTWRYYDGTTRSWKSIQPTLPQNLTPYTWHTLRLYGNIENGQTHYISFFCDNVFKPLDLRTNSYATTNADSMTVAMQLDADGSAHPYQFTMDKVTFQWD